MSTKLTGNFTADGQSSVFKVVQPKRASDNVTITLAAQGPFGSGTVSLQFSLDDGTTWNTITDGTTAATLTAAGMINHTHSPFGTTDIDYRLDLNGSTSPDINYALSITG